MKKQWGFIVAAVMVFGVLAGCGAQFQKALTKEELGKYQTASDFTKDRYSNFQVSLGLSKWQRSETADRIVTSFLIASNPTMINSSTKAFVDDMSGYCSAHGGAIMDLRQANANHRRAIESKYTVQAERDYFECGPEGRGTTSHDWTKFNPATCRKLYSPKVDFQKVLDEYGTPVDLQCAANNDFLFLVSMGYNRYSSQGSQGVDLLVRMNESKSGLIKKTSEQGEMQ